MRLVLTLAAALGVALFCTLGAWQYGRGVEKERLLAAQSAALAAAPRQLPQALENASEGIERVEGSVEYVAPLLLLDGQSNHGRIGLRAYAVARVAAQRAVLVDLGWLPMPADRSLPAQTVPAAREVRGTLAPWPGQGLRAAENPWPADATGVLLTYLDREEIEHHLGVPLAARVLRLDPAADHGYERSRDLLPNTLPPERHFGYALQWYALAATVAVVWLVLTLRSSHKGKP